MEKKNDKSVEAVMSKEALKEIANENRKALAQKKEEKKPAKAAPAKPIPKKTPTATTKPTNDKPRAGVNDWGHRLGSQAAQIDEAIKKVAKGKAPEIGVLAKATGLSNGRVSSHLKHLKAEKRI